MSTVALCIPARNAAAYLPRLFQSVDKQTCSFDEILVYDDASCDDTAAIARASGATVIRSDHNTGPSIGKNLLAAHATSEWIHFHDADDALYPDFVEHAREWFTRDADVVCFAIEDRDHDTDAVLIRHEWDDAALCRDAVRYAIANTITNCGLYRRAAFLASGGFDVRPETKYNEDQAMHLRLAVDGLRFRADSRPGGILYQRRNSMSSGNKIECARAHFHVLATVAEQTGNGYADALGAELWKLAGVCGTYRDWPYVRRALELADELGYAAAEAENPLFRTLARIHPLGAVMAREQFVRWFKPALRQGVPTASP
jgi:glycosyltransferase involved in cell wall biosynthesis